MNFLQKRQEFLRKLLCICRYKIKKYILHDKYNTSWYNCFPEWKVNTIITENKQTGFVFFDTYNFNPTWNNRDILLSEGVLEIEAPNFETSIKGTWDTCINLIRRKIRFSVYYAQGMRTPHIHIYDLFPDALDWAEKELAMNLFANQVVSLEYRHFLDRNLFSQHSIALEYAKHYRTGYVKKLLCMKLLVIVWRVLIL